MGLYHCSLVLAQDGSAREPTGVAEPRVLRRQPTARLNDEIARNNFLSGLKVRDEGARTC